MADRAEAAIVAAGDREALQQNLYLDAACVLMLFGAVATVGIGTTSADHTQALVVPAAGRFPRAVLAHAAIAIAVLKHLFTLWN